MERQMSGSGQTETEKNMQRMKVLERPETLEIQKTQNAAESESRI